MKNLVNAGYPLILCPTLEEHRLLQDVAPDYTFDVHRGHSRNSDLTDPSELPAFTLSLPPGMTAVLDAHRIYSGEDIASVRALVNVLPALQARGHHFLLFTHPAASIAAELTQYVTQYDYPLPSPPEYVSLAQRLVDSNNLSVAIPDQLQQACRGMTLRQAEDAISLAIITGRGQFIDLQTLQAQKLQAISQSGLATLADPVPPSSIGGLETLKKYVSSRARAFSDPSLPRPRGILLTGLPGSGKSLSAKAVASILDLPLLRVDLASLKGSLVGESERNMRRLTDMIDAISPVVVWMDEIEKAVAGAQSSGRTDGGTSIAMFGHLLTWLQERSTAYTVATCNDIGVLLSLSQGALLRRFDATFFVDLPATTERRKIIEIHADRLGINPADYQLDTTGWTGAEIETWLRNSMFDGVQTAHAQIRPIAVQNAAIIEAARQWATMNAIPANEPEAVPATISAAPTGGRVLAVSAKTFNA